MEPGGEEARIQANARTFLPGAPEFTGETDAPLEGAGFELVWVFSCQVVIFGL
jgi:hypothetical protein